MNILHISSATSWRGGEQQIAYLSSELHKMGQNNFLMYPFDAPIAKDDIIRQSCTLLPYHKGFSINPLVSFKIKKIVKEHDIDIIHVHDSHAHTFLYLSYKLFGLTAPSVVSRRVDVPISKSSLKKYSEPRISKIICVSNKIKEVISSSIGSTDRIVTVHDGIDLISTMPKEPVDLRSKYEISNHHKIIANIAAVADIKDYTTYVEAAAIVLEQVKDLTFLIIGGDEGEWNLIQNLIKSKGLSERIIMTGYIPHASHVLNQLDIFFFPSKMEGLGTSLLDAQAAGVPIVSTYAGGIPEIITHKHTGLLSQIGDAPDLANNLKLLLENYTLRKNLTQQATLNVNKYSKKVMAEKTFDIYKDVI